MSPNKKDRMFERMGSERDSKVTDIDQTRVGNTEGLKNVSAKRERASGKIDRVCVRRCWSVLGKPA